MQLQYQPPFLLHDFAKPCGKQTADNKSTYALFECFCGETFFACTGSVQKGHTRSCGCLRNTLMDKKSTTHGLSNHPLYNIWNAMMNRTNNIKNKRFSSYGGRGIKVCARWLNISNFIEDMYPSYCVGLSLDRIDNDGNYEPSNCRWTSSEVQNRNRRVRMSNNTSGYRGVTWDKRNNKWSASIGVNKKVIRIGRFDTAISAAIAYDNYVIRHNLEHTINNVGI
jgi:hypothetical protein